ncbi:MAG TPA: hypothetical protein VK601_30880, partial [Kofleriaceae bacterium]|nr:hypothetical protein [Kofleriaceae bacterium]
MLLAGCGADQRQPSNDPVALVFSLPADSWRSGGLVRQPIGTVEVTVIDARSERVTSFRGETTLALGNNPTGAHLRGSVTATISAGVARFGPVAIDQVGTGYTLVASSDGLPPVTSAPLDIVEPTFAPLPTGIAGGPITSIAVSRVEGELASAVFVGASDGVYRSVDGGATWKPASFGGEASAVLVADPVRPDLLYLSRAGDAGFVKQTSDAGATWRPLGQDDPATADNVRAVAIDPKNPSVIYAAGAHLHRSSDRGATWTHQPDPIYCAKLAVDAVSDTLYCSGFAVTRSTDGGAHWTVADTRIHPDSDSALVATPSGVFAGSDLFFYRSRDGGVSWDPVAVGRATAVTYTPLLPDQVYVATDRGIAVSQDGGAHFGDPSGPKDVVGLAADPLDFRVAYAASRTGVFVSRNSGASWEFASTGIDAHAIRSVALAPGAAQTMLASFHGALMRTVDGGTSWSVVAPEPSFTGGTGFAEFDPKVAGRAYACGDAFAISVDGGASFTPIAGPGPVGCTRILFHDATMTVGSLNRVYRSTSGGETWAMAGAVGDFGITSDLAFGDALGTVVLAAHG